MATATVTCSITISDSGGGGTGGGPTSPGDPNLYLALIGAGNVTGTALTLTDTLTNGVPLNSADFIFLGAPIMITGAGPGGTPFWTTIAAIIDSTHATLTDAVVQSVSNAEIDAYFPIIENVDASIFKYYVMAGSYDFESSLSTRPTLNFEIFTKPVNNTGGLFIPQVGMPALLIIEGMGDVFGGSIDQVQTEAIPGQIPVTSKCQCVSWDQVLAKRLLMLTGAFPLGTSTDTFVGDGDQALFSLSAPPVGMVAVSVDGVSQTFGINTTLTYLSWEVGNPIVTIFGTPPGVGAVLSVTYQAVGAVVAPPIYFNQTADQIFFALVNTIAASEGLAAVAVPGPLVDQLSFTTQDTVASALALLTSYINNGGVNYWFYVDSRKRVHFDIQGATQLAPWNISVADASDQNVLIRVSLTTTREQFANAAWADIAAAAGLSTLQQVFVGDGTSRSFQTNFPISRVSSCTRILNNGVTLTSIPQELIINGQTPSNAGDVWFYDINQTTITEGPNNPTMINSGTLSGTIEYLLVVYYPSAAVTQQSRNLTSAAARHAIEGGSGEYDLYVNLSNTNVVLATATVAENYANYYAQMAQRLEIETYRSGLRTGQGIIVDLPQLNAVATVLGAPGAFIVDGVKLTDENNIWKWTVTLAAGAIVGDWKRAMVRLANLL